MFKQIAAGVLALALLLGIESAAFCWGTGYSIPAAASQPLQA
ncbi:hypothetical protein [Kutzneria chonburiensis]|uniref:Cyclic lactone autoinducer peptide n=1 Tax=Kutzneria chonburiensis TaxID=1483604 RepID=A0ABV6N115_9PSEU|nr:hypothetical protein [Kutzneria chonburiensis]